jgi:hypothetical protein
MEAIEWIFDGIGTLLIGLLIGAGGGGLIGWRIGVSSRRQSQRAGRNANQTQVGGDQKIKNDRRGR